LHCGSAITKSNWWRGGVKLHGGFGEKFGRCLGFRINFEVIVMPKLYDYFGLIIMFYANEHEPVHVHGKSQGREARAEFIIVDGEVIEISFSDVTGRQALQSNEMRYFKEIVTAKTDEIVKKMD
jgi:hypothetical protein